MPFAIPVRFSRFKRCAASRTQPARRAGVVAGWALLLALGLSGCAGSGGLWPGGTSDKDVAGASLLPCKRTPAALQALDRAAQEARRHGLALQSHCDERGGGWVLSLTVADDRVASRTVRGPLALGQPVDMGTAVGVVSAGARRGAGGFSPDVAFNRDWLRSLMERHHFDNRLDAWWHFSQRRPVKL